MTETKEINLHVKSHKIVDDGVEFVVFSEEMHRNFWVTCNTDMQVDSVRSKSGDSVMISDDTVKTELIRVIDAYVAEKTDNPTTVYATQDGYHVACRDFAHGMWYDPTGKGRYVQSWRETKPLKSEPAAKTKAKKFFGVANVVNIRA